ncbi:FtsX-like permease family protein [Fibrella sp. HMF5335]|uniref:FtsX-like permease family protein n=1 Tax=Fibrella rubiginis TaxID=2817060 RepID=A0A939GE15_9BACT|nr:FtsX-like permease family protein [Fibrella rubiginis]MBO0935115.1 FtsX-like permease family protein [Fibrella rubiginis]
MQTFYLKVLRDVTTDYARSLTLVLAIALGVSAIGAILGGYAVVSREMTVNYGSTRPAAATIELEGDITRALVDSVRALPNIETAARRTTLTARMRVQNRWYPMLLFVVDDMNDHTISTVRLLSGRAEPPAGTMLVERTALAIMQAREGERMFVKTANGPLTPLRIVGTVHDPALAPAAQEQAGYGYITLTTLHSLGEKQGFDQIKLRFVTGGESAETITKQAETVATWLAQRGHAVHEIQVPPPNRHPHQSQMTTMLSIFIVFSFLVLLLASILVSVSVATLMVKQVRQIGIMKTIGAGSGQIAGLYLLQIGLYCLAALVVGIPLSRVGASVLATRVGTLLNLDLTNPSVPGWVAGVQVVTGLLLPLLAVLFPVVRGSRLSVRKALDNVGVSSAKVRPMGWINRLGTWLSLSETVRLSVRNVFRQQARLIMTLGLLAAGGAMFMTALNVSAAWDKSLAQIYAQRLFDLEIRLGQPLSPATLAQLRAVEGVNTVEAGALAPVSFASNGPYTISHAYPDKGHGSFKLQALSLPARLLRPTLTAGRWLSQPGAMDVVLNQSARRAGTKSGDLIVLSVGRKKSTWRVVGFAEDVGSPATAYVSAGAFARATLPTDRTYLLRIAFANRDRAYTTDRIRMVDAILAQANVVVVSSVPTWLVKNAVGEHMKILVNALLAMAVLMALVGSLALFSTMSLNVLERTREIGVMRAIGATPATVNALIVWEGLIIGFLSFFVAFAGSLLLSFYLGRSVGNMSFRTPLNLTISPLATGGWVVILVVGSYLATLFPARRASRITTREALAYE